MFLLCQLKGWREMRKRNNKKEIVSILSGDKAENIIDNPKSWSAWKEHALDLRTQIVLLQAERDGILSELLSLQRECIDANKKIRYLENEKGERNEPNY